MVNGIAEQDFEQSRQVLYRYCMKLTESTWEADDLVQESCAKALAYLRDGRTHANLSALLMRTARNLWVDQKRRERTMKLIMNEQQLYELASSNEQSAISDAERWIHHLVTVLSPLQLTVFMMRDIFQYKAQETAHLLLMSESAVKAALFRARRNIERERGSWKDDALDKPMDEWTHELALAYSQAFERSDVTAMIQLAMTYSQAASGIRAVGQYQVTQQVEQHGSLKADNPVIQMCFAA